MSSIPSAFSIVIPLYNEELNIIPLCDEIFSVMNTDFIGSNYEVILVNDGSID
jgi:glycosyltransferase involved in cell wall biosynthesis